MPHQQNTSQNPSSLCLQPTAARLYLGALLLAEFALMDTGFVFFLANPPPRSPEVAPPQVWVLVPFLILTSAFMATMTLTAIWMIAQYFVHRITIADDHLTIRTCFRFRRVESRAVTRVEWKPGGIEITSNTMRTSIDLDGYSAESIADLFEYIHNAFPLEIQHNWLKFVEAVDRAHQPQIPKYYRWLAVPIIVVFLTGGAITALAWFNLGGASILLGSLAFFAVGLWYIWSFATFRDENALIRRKMAKTGLFLRTPR